MTFLPIVQRELRAATRRQSTYRIRWWAALIALAITLVSITFISLSRGPRGSGGGAFVALTGYAFVLCLLSGVMLTADAIAREKREGTLGLLLLTDLRGYDIVLGKFLARSLNAFYALLAILPAAALPLLLGGLEGGEFVRTSLALFNALCLSAAAGLFASVLTRESQNAFSNGLVVVILLTVVLPATAAGLRTVGVAPVWQAVAWLSPGFAYAHAATSSYVGREGTFWAALASSQLFAWLLLGVASAALPRCFQERQKPVRLQPQHRAARPVPKARRARHGLLEGNPVLWLRASELGTPHAAWLIVALWAVAATLIFIFSVDDGSTGPTEWASLPEGAARVFGFFLKMLFAMHVCRFFIDARRDGTLELLLCTPLSNQDIIHGQMKALWRAYRWPFYLLLLLLFLPLLLGLAVRSTYPTSGSVLSMVGAVVFAGGFPLRLAADIAAILWFGTALALTSRRPHLAPAWTVLCVLVLPAPLSACWLDILVDLGLISWGINQCRLDLRRLVAEQYQAYSQPTAPAWSPFRSQHPGV